MYNDTSILMTLILILIFLARKVLYNDTYIVATGASITTVQSRGSTVKITFNFPVNIHVTSTFADTNRTSCGYLFELYNGTAWHGANGVVGEDNSTVIVSVPNKEVQDSVWNDIRYAWYDAPFCAVYNDQGLPTPPFTAGIDFLE